MFGVGVRVGAGLVCGTLVEVLVVGEVVRHHVDAVGGDRLREQRREPRVDLLRGRGRSRGRGRLGLG